MAMEIKQLFQIADRNDDGVLQPAEMKKLLELSGFKLSPMDIDELVKSADVNKDGVIDWKECLPAMMQLVDTLYPAMPALDKVPKEELEKYLRDLFAVADKNGDGVLSFEEFRKMLNK